MSLTAQLLSALKANKMDDIKVYGLNTFAFFMSIFDRVDAILKVTLLLVSIGYTIAKWYQLHKGKKEE